MIGSSGSLTNLVFTNPNFFPTNFAACFDLLKTDFCLRIKIEKRVNINVNINVNIYMPAKILCASPGMKPLLLGMAAGAQVNNFLKAKGWVA